MRLGVGSYAFRWAVGTTDFRPTRPMTCADMVDEAARLGCGLLQISDNAELDGADDDDLTALREHALRRGIALQVGATGSSVEVLMRYLDVAVATGADLVRVVLDDNTGCDAATQDSTAIEWLSTVATHYERAGVTLGVENHFRVTSPRLEVILDRVGSRAVGAVLDVANSIVCGEWPEYTVARLARHTKGVHLKDYDLVPELDGVGARVIGTPLGRGRTDVAAVLDAVSPVDDGRLGIVLELWCPRATTESKTLATETAWREDSMAEARRQLCRPGPPGEAKRVAH
ncbi:TIM barrel protein [Saccharomonospora sp. NPDC046836]|uniref:sugar phosphate isomerase/epimerase family protein n=1 Tax=Saccharomonospora sp. NPDC046836 TaxID=3156921 RepID=UPI0033EBD778